MRFVVDNQLPPRLSRFLADAGHDAVHVTMVGLDAADDQTVWAWAIREARVLVSKDEDFLYFAHRQGDRGRLLWVRLGNCRRDVLLDLPERNPFRNVGSDWRPPPCTPTLGMITVPSSR